MQHASALTQITPKAIALSVEDLFAELTAGLASGQDLEVMLKRFLKPVISLTGATAASVRRVSDDGLKMLLVGELGLPERVALAERSVDRHCGVCGSAADGNAVVSSSSLQTCRMRSGCDFFDDTCKQVLAVPLRHRGNVLGVYNLYFNQATHFSTELSAVLRSVGDLLGLALHNARLERDNLHATVMNERQLMANEVHDAVAQTLAYMKMRLPLLDDAIHASDEAASLKYCGDLRRAVTEAHASLREILTLFRTRMDPQGLVHALKGVTAGFEDRTGIALAFEDDAAELRLSVEQELQMFHIAQEALANIAKHSLARKAKLSLKRVAGQIAMTVEDDGSGVAAMPLVGHEAANASQAHFGIEIMQERARCLGGTVTVTERPEGGTQVQVLIPDARRGLNLRPQARP